MPWRAILYSPGETLTSTELNYLQDNSNYMLAEFAEKIVYNGLVFYGTDEWGMWGEIVTIDGSPIGSTGQTFFQDVDIQGLDTGLHALFIGYSKIYFFKTPLSKFATIWIDTWVPDLGGATENPRFSASVILTTEPKGWTA